jgi:hypothetical protein
MKRQITIFILVNILLQSCVVYQKSSVSVDDAANKGKVMFENNEGKKIYLNNIIYEDGANYINEDGTYYGIWDNNQMVPMNSIDSSDFYLKDIKASSNRTGWAIVGFVIIPLGIIIGMELYEVRFY